MRSLHDRILARDQWEAFNDPVLLGFFTRNQVRRGGGSDSDVTEEVGLS